MKRILLSTIVALCVANMADGQRFYVKAGGGYALPHASQTLNIKELPYSGSFDYLINNTGNTSFNYTLKKASFTSGVQAMIGAGYLFNKNIGVELNAVAGVVTKKHTFQSTKENIGPTYINSTATQYSKLPVLLIPSLVMQLPKDKMALYLRIGAALPMSNKLIYTEEETFTTDPTVAPTARKTSMEVSTRFNLGISSAIGGRYQLGKTLYGWAELSSLSMSLYTKEMTFTEYTVNNIDALPQVAPQNLHQEFKMKQDIDNTSASNIRPAYALPYGNISFNIGITKQFGESPSPKPVVRRAH